MGGEQTRLGSSVVSFSFQIEFVQVHDTICVRNRLRKEPVRPGNHDPEHRVIRLARV